MRLLVLALLTGAALGCQAGSMQPDFEDPEIIRAKDVPVRTNLRGSVVSLASGHPIAGARVEAAGQVSVTSEDGKYNLQLVHLSVIELVTTSEGFQQRRTMLPLSGNDQEFVIRLIPTTE